MALYHDVNRQNYINPLISLIKNPYFFMMWFSFALFSYFYLDQPIASFMYLNSFNVLDKIATVLTFFGSGWLYVGLFIALFLIARYVTNNSKLAATSFFLLLIIGVPGVACDILKMLFGRSRPTELMTQHLYGFYFLQDKNGFWSFPSGHATVTAALMVAFSLIWPRLWWLFTLMIFFVGASRIILDFHFLSDVMVGMYLGAVLAIGVYEFIQRQTRLTIYGINRV